MAAIRQRGGLRWVAAPPSTPPSTSTLPAWLLSASAAVNDWVEISGSNRSATPPTILPYSSPADKCFDGWGAVAYDSRINMAWSWDAGGHVEGYTNGVAKFNLRADWPVWAQVQASSIEANITVNSSLAYYKDGRPAACHMYNTLQFVKSLNRVMRFGAVGPSGSVGTVPVVDGFDCNCDGITEGFDPAGTYASTSTGQLTVEQGACQDPVTEDFWGIADNVYVVHYSVAGNSWTIYTPTIPNARGAALVYDTARNWIFGVSELACFTFDLTSHTFTNRSLTGSAAAAVQVGVGNHIIKSPWNGKYVYCNNAGGGVVYEIDPDASFSAEPITTTGGGSQPGTGNAVWGKMALVEDLNDSNHTGGILLFREYTQNAWFLRLN